MNDAGENLVGEHADREDEKQTVIVPGLGTTLTDAETREHISLASKKTVQIDTIAYEGLVAGKTYTSVGFLADPETGYALKADGTTYAELDIVSIYKSASGSSKEEVIASLIKTAEDNSLLYATAEFTAEAAEGEATVTFEYDSTPFAGREVVAAESIYDEKGKPIAVHFDPKDEDQTVWIPKIATKAAGDNGEKVLPEDVTDVAIKDTLTWEGVKAQTTFKVVTKAFAKGETKEDDVLLADTSAEPKVITASGETGTASIIVKVDTTGHGGKSIYISEYCYLETPDGDKLIGKHEGRNDKAQTVSVPHIGTVLEDAVTMSHISFVEKEVTQKDTINYDGLVKGKDYTAVGIMTDRETGFALVKGGGTYTGKAVTELYDPKAPAADTIALLESINVIYATADFTAEDTKGQAEVVFTYDAVPFAGGAAVAAEAIYPFGKEPVAVHFSPTDEDQTVWFPEIVTKAVDKADGTKLVAADKDAVIAAFCRMSEIVGVNSMGWRYDPILITERYTEGYHLRAFEEIARALEGYTQTVVISFIDLYPKVRRNFPEAREVPREQRLSLGKKIIEIASAHGMTVKPCAEGDDLAVYGADCGGCMRISDYEKAIGRRLTVPRRKGARSACACYLACDIGAYNTCRHLCRYCYANAEADVVLAQSRLHDPASPFLIGNYQEGDRIHDVPQQSWIDGQTIMRFE